MSAEIFHGYSLLGEWKNSQCGKTAKAKKDGKTYFLKRYQTPVEPIDNGTLDPTTFKHNKDKFDKFYITRKKINETIRALSGPGGNIIIPSEEFIEGNQYVEASEFINGAVDDDDLEATLATLSVDTKKLLLLTAAGALLTIHSKNIVHSDLKLKNVLLFKTSSNVYVAKLIDFDSSYFADDKPDEIVGDIIYYSPELGAYSDAEDDREELGKKLTTKSDIFSLGLIFHFYLTGTLPEPSSLTDNLRKRKEKGKVVYCWVALNAGCKLELSPKITNPECLSLISDMLNRDPGARPSAREVIKRLQPIDLSKSGVLICAPWPEHKIVFDEAKIDEKGYSKVEQSTLNGVKGYIFTEKETGTTRFLRVEMVINQKMAKKV